MISRLFALACLLVTSFSPQDSVEALIAALESDDVGIRDRASAELVRVASRAKSALEAAARSPLPETRARAETILRKAFPLRIVFGFDPTDADPGKPLPVDLHLYHGPAGEVLRHRRGVSFRIELLEAHERPAGDGTYRSRGWGRGGTGCALSESDFLLLREGIRLEQREDDLRGWTAVVPPDQRRHLGAAGWWNVGLAGRYRLLASYRFERTSYLAICGKACAGHGDPAKAWNRCPEETLEAQADFVVRRRP